MKSKAPFDVVCFDCDSTLSRVEGIDELAERAGIGEEMAALTKAAMDGSLKLEAIYARRLELIRPNTASIQWLAARYIDERVEGAGEVIAALKRRGKAVHIISGGIRQAILPLAAMLGVAKENVHAVDLHFAEDGSYAGFDTESPLAKSGGKAAVCNILMNSSRSLTLVGDGITDVEAADAGAFVIGFGGVASRDLVRRSAAVYIDSAALTPVLEHILTPFER
ncbi:MAG: HAD-IB family phosphatase [Pseudomonadota bacterium]